MDSIGELVVKVWSTLVVDDSTTSDVVAVEVVSGLSSSVEVEVGGSSVGSGIRGVVGIEGSDFEDDIIVAITLDEGNAVEVDGTVSDVGISVGSGTGEVVRIEDWAFEKDVIVALVVDGGNTFACGVGVASNVPVVIIKLLEPFALILFADSVLDIF